MIQRKRRREEEFEPEPQALEEFSIPDHFRTVLHGQREDAFLLHDDWDGEGERNQERIIIFASHELLTLLQQSQNWMLDGTFKTAPALFFQLYTIHAVLGDYVIPCIYALLPNKRAETYRRMFGILKDNQEGLHPQLAIIDFEVASNNALEDEFPGVRVEGCYFHLCQSVWRNAQHNGLSEAYVNNEVVRRYVKMLCALAFLPVDDVIPGFEELYENIEREEDLPDGLLNLFHNFEDTYIGRPNRRRGRRLPMFNTAMWNVRQRTDSGIPRTNNKLEGWHRAMQTNFDSPHPSMWKFLQALKREEAAQYFILQQRIAGEPPPPMQKKYRELNQRIERIIQLHQAGETTIMDFLRGIGYNISPSV